MSNFNFTPGQREEALAWVNHNCGDFLALVHDSDILDRLIDMYFKLKSMSFNLAPEEFVVGVEYKNEDAVTEGKEPINIRINNPHRGDKPHNHFALQVLMNIFNNQKG